MSLLAFCNPLLDITVPVEQDFLDKYGLEPNNAILAEDKHEALFTEILADARREFSAGGAAQNSMRAAQWLLPPGSCTFVGCVGDDEQAAQLRQVAEADGLRVEYAVAAEHPTGLCACLIKDHGRSLVARLGAANHYPPAHVDTIIQVIQSARIIYGSGYFLTVAPTVITRVLSEATPQQITALNLSAPFIPQFFGQPLREAMAHADWIFGNEAEALAWAQSNQLKETKPLTIALHLHRLPSQRGSRSVCITQGADPTILITPQYPEGLLIPVMAIPKSEIVDTNGAGDAFVGAFLAMLSLGRPLEEACRAGHWVAGQVIRQSGVHFDPAHRPTF